MKIYGEITVIVYIDSDFGGDYIYLTGSHIDFGRDHLLRRFNDEISSIEVVPGIVLETNHRAGEREYLLNSQLLESALFSEEVPANTTYGNPAGGNEPPVDSPPGLTPELSYSESPRVILYDQPNFQGNQMVLTPGSTQVDLSRITKEIGGTWNDSVSSISVEGNAELFLYTDADFRGDGIALRESVANLSLAPDLITFVNSISSVVVNSAY
jgi:hypothetical protein